MAHKLITCNGEQRSRWVPDEAIEVLHPEGLGACYVYRSRRGNRAAMVGYAGNSTKQSFHYGYATMDALDLALCNFFDNLSAHKKRVAERRKAAYSGHSFKVGDIVYNSWGYDQTNVDWYVITRTSKAYVWVKRIAASQTLDAGIGPMSGMCEPTYQHDDPTKLAISEKYPEEKHLAEGSNVRFEFGSGSKWDGKPKYESWYA